MFSFFAYLSRMKLIKRWSLMRSVQPENIQEHSHQVAVIAHCLAEIDNRLFGAENDCAKIALLGIYHDVGEVIVGDLPTPVKYFNPEIKQSYSQIENIAKEKLLNMLPEELREAYVPLLFADEECREGQLVKAADKICAYIKCLEEVTAGNGEFNLAKQSIERDLEKYRKIPAVQWFMEHCIQAFSCTLDELG